MAPASGGKIRIIFSQSFVLDLDGLPIQRFGLGILADAIGIADRDAADLLKINYVC